MLQYVMILLFCNVTICNDIMFCNVTICNDIMFCDVTMCNEVTKNLL